MPDLASWGTLALVVLIVTAGAAGQAAIGMGLNLFTIPFLVMIDPVFAPGPVLAASLLLSLLAMWRVPGEIDRRELALLLCGLIVGTLIAAAILVFIDAAHLVRLLGFLVVVAVATILSGLSSPLTTLSLLGSGGASGIMGTIAGVHAPPIALLYQGQSPARVRGAVLTSIGIGNALSVAALWAVDRFTARELWATLVLLPGIAFGLVLAPTLLRWLDAKRIRWAILTISGASGLALMIRGA